LGVPVAIRARTPTTDTYSLPQTQEEFFFSMPLGMLDVVLQARNEGRSTAAVAADLGYRVEQIERAYHEIEHKRAITRPLHLTSLLVAPVPDVGVAVRDEGGGGGGGSWPVSRAGAQWGGALP